jgi:hypothetical protein
MVDVKIEINTMTLTVDKEGLTLGEASPPGAEKPRGYSVLVGPPVPRSLLKN